MVITVVIPTYNRRVSLANCLESLFRQTCRCDQFEIIVVIDGSIDGTADYLRTLTFPCANQTLEQRNRGQAAARNAGIRAAKGKYILLVDDDFICDSSLLEEHLHAHNTPGVVVVGPILRDAADRGIPSIAVDREIRPYYEQHSAGMQPEAWLPPNSSLERDLLLSCGGYDEDFGSAREDTELGLRLAERGVQFAYAPNAVVHQRYSKSAVELVHDAEMFGTNDVVLLRKRPDYIRFTNLAQIDRGPVWKKIVRRLVNSSPISVEPGLALLYRIIEPMRGVAPMREIAIRLLNLRRYTVWLRAAVRQAGGWNQLEQLVERCRESGRERP